MKDLDGEVQQLKGGWLNRRMGWRIYLWVVVAILAVSWLELFDGELTTHDLIDIPETLVAVTGLAGYAYQRAILFPLVWRVAIFLIPPWDIYYNLHAGRALGEVFPVLGLVLPAYVALFLYGYRSKRIWAPASAE